MILMQKLKELRKLKTDDVKLTQEQAALLIGVSERQYSRWETGDQTPRLEKLIRISEVYSVTFDSLVDPEVSIKYKSFSRKRKNTTK